jgi:ABC-type multidrug transport system fused ATPase/permease subunit
MKSGDFLNGIIHLFNDLIGSVVPGLILGFGLLTLGCIPEAKVGQFQELESSAQWFLIIIVAYVAGHALLSMHRLLQTYIGKPMRFLNTLLKKHELDSRVSDKVIEDSRVYKNFSEAIKNRANTLLSLNDDDTFKINNLRSMAMTISKEGSELATRFMFFSLFCYGVSMSILVVGSIHLIQTFSWGWFGLLVLVFFLFYTRGIDFEYRALNVPFPIALAVMLFE